MPWLPGSPFIVDFRADWCAPCREFEEKVLKDPEVQAMLAGIGFYTVDVTDAGDKQAAGLVKEFKVLGVPTLLFFNSQGREIGRITEFMDKNEFIKRIKKSKE